MMFEKAEFPEGQLRLADTFQMIHIEACVDGDSPQNELWFKLTPETIGDLVDIHRYVYPVRRGASMLDCPDLPKRVQKEFIQAVSKFRFRASASVLEELDESDAGMLSAIESERAKALILALFTPEPPLHGHNFYSMQTVNEESSFFSELVNPFWGPLNNPWVSWPNWKAGLSPEPGKVLLPPLQAENGHWTGYTPHAGELQHFFLAGTSPWL